MFNFLDVDRFHRQVNIFLTENFLFDILKSEAEEVILADTKILVASKKQLLEMKRAMYPPRQKDVLDIQYLEEQAGEKELKWNEK